MVNSVRIGCALPSEAVDPGALGDLAQAAEAAGYDSVWLSDHIVIPERIARADEYIADGHFLMPASTPDLEPLASLAYLAGITRNVRLGTWVLILPYRHPLLTAKMVATIDRLSGGRFDLGIGVGWLEEEFQALGQNTFARRGAVADEQLRILQAVWTNEVMRFEGEFYRFDAIGAHPHPLQTPHPPIWVGGHSRAALRRVARYGNGWFPHRGGPIDLSPAEVAASLDFIRKEAGRVGRDPADVHVRLSTGVALLDRPLDEPRRFAGTPDAIVADFEQYREVGVHDFNVFLAASATDYERHLRRFADEVRPGLVSGPAVQET